MNDRTFLILRVLDFFSGECQPEGNLWSEIGEEDTIIKHSFEKVSLHYHIHCIWSSLRYLWGSTSRPFLFWHVEKCPVDFDGLVPGFQSRSVFWGLVLDSACNMVSCSRDWFSMFYLLLFRLNHELEPFAALIKKPSSWAAYSSLSTTEFPSHCFARKCGVCLMNIKRLRLLAASRSKSRFLYRQGCLNQYNAMGNKIEIEENHNDLQPTFLSYLYSKEDKTLE